MDRTKEYLSFVDIAREAEPAATEERFYETLYRSILRLEETLGKTASLKTVLALEDEFYKLEKHVGLILGAVEVAAAEDIVRHYDGVKQILSGRIARLARTIRETKNRISSAGVDLDPERPQSFGHASAGSERPQSFRRAGTSQVLEQENRQITEHQGYEMARSRLQKIETVQKAINENLVMQDERIDSICTVSGGTRVIYDKMAAGDDFDSGSFIRRFVFIVLMCLSFVLLFLHFFYR